MIINKGDIIEVYDEDNLTICQSCIGIVEKVSYCFVIFRVAKIFEEETVESMLPTHFQHLVKSAKGQIRATTLENIIRHSPTVPVEFAKEIEI